jgi:hypothetical protein
MADKSLTPASPLSMAGRANSLANKCLRLLTKNKSNAEINPQLNSPLFTRLPQELRDKIWKFVFEPPKNAKPAHFHIYDHVYDACTYKKPSDNKSLSRAELRKKQTHIALLMSCRRIYNEALHYLYDQSKFTFVVSAGLPREHCKKKYEDRCKRLGRVRDCEQLFRRIRNLTIIIQPGKKPHIDLYTHRLHELLSALGYGESLQNLTLLFNWRLEIVGHDPTQARRAKIVKALYPLQAHMASKVAARKCKLTVLSWLAEQNTEEIEEGEEGKYIQLIRTIGGLDKESYDIGERPQNSRRPSHVPKCKIMTWSPASKDDMNTCVKYGADLCCLERGAFGEDSKILLGVVSSETLANYTQNHPDYALKQMQPMTRTPLHIPFLPGVNVSKEEMECAVFLTGYVLFLPITAPITAYAILNRKKKKGEWNI